MCIPLEQLLVEFQVFKWDHLTLPRWHLCVCGVCVCERERDRGRVNEFECECECECECEGESFTMCPSILYCPGIKVQGSSFCSGVRL